DVDVRPRTFQELDDEGRRLLEASALGQVEEERVSRLHGPPPDPRGHANEAARRGEGKGRRGARSSAEAYRRPPTPPRVSGRIDTVRAVARDDAPSTKPRIDKLGVKAGMRVSVLGVDDSAFLEELRERTPDPSLRRRARCDLLFVGFDERSRLARLGARKDVIAPDGAVWVIWPKGSNAINENDVRDAAL